MGRRHEPPASLGAILSHVLQQAGTQHDRLHQIQTAWGQMVGAELAQHSRPMTIRRDILYVHSDEPGTSYLLSLKPTEYGMCF